MKIVKIYATKKIVKKKRQSEKWSNHRFLLVAKIILQDFLYLNVKTECQKNITYNCAKTQAQ